ncbi:MAG: hypothetical protein JXB07_14990, partial [Anaerolineae bacterium]|nr:hypothetical protein [Anaerolineae bacterium]
AEGDRTRGGETRSMVGVWQQYGSSMAAIACVRIAVWPHQALGYLTPAGLYFKKGETWDGTWGRDMERDYLWNMLRNDMTLPDRLVIPAQAGIHRYTEHSLKAFRMLPWRSMFFCIEVSRKYLAFYHNLMNHPRNIHL